MLVDQFYELVSSIPGATEDFPFGPDVAVFKVAGKMFATLNVDGPPFRSNLKCDPERAVELRSEYESVVPGYHMNKRHWNTVEIEGDVPDTVIRELIRHSYDLVVNSLPAKRRPSA
ncbi:MAG: MmcQ/YjbR family DNA-binding protein [Rhodothermales bacterium]|nr:MmcQ/YjbR family DNA-binding protein [Rhodothermales bacterium]